jgi:hypothetical protein
MLLATLKLCLDNMTLQFINTFFYFYVLTYFLFNLTNSTIKNFFKENQLYEEQVHDQL